VLIIRHGRVDIFIGKQRQFPLPTVSSASSDLDASGVTESSRSGFTFPSFDNYQSTKSNDHSAPVLGAPSTIGMYSFCRLCEKVPAAAEMRALFVHFMINFDPVQFLHFGNICVVVHVAFW